MARQWRVEYPGAVHHVTTRGVARGEIFFSDAGRLAFLSRLGEVCERWGLVVHGYCLMTNHYHLEVESPEGPLSKPLQWLNQNHASYINRTYGRDGHLFQGRFKSAVIEADTHLHGLTRYIHLNPVRAGMVKHPGDYRWSSYREILGLRKGPSWLSLDATLKRFVKFRGHRTYLLGSSARRGLRRDQAEDRVGLPVPLSGAHRSVCGDLVVGLRVPLRSVRLRAGPAGSCGTACWELGLCL